MLFVGAVHASDIQTTKQLHHALTLVYQTHRYTFLEQRSFPPSFPIQWMPIVPMQTLFGDLPCYQEKMCLNKRGVPFKGLRCCRQKYPWHYRAYFDLHNWVPEADELKRQRKQYSFGLITSSPATTGHPFSVHSLEQIIEPPPSQRGEIARIYLYMHDRYHFSLSPQMHHCYLTWHQQYPPTRWEQLRNQKIIALQGNGNPYVQSNSR